MNRPGDRARRLAARLCSARACGRLVDPAVADLQAEVAVARRTGSSWQMLRTLAAGYLSLAKVLLIAICGDVRARATVERNAAAGTRRGAWIALGITTVATALLELPLLQSMPSESSLGERFRLATYLAPSTLALSVPLGLAIASGWILHGPARTRKVSGVALLTALLTSAAMFANLGWLTPDANQAFRETVMAHYDPAPPMRGDGELRFGELRDRLHQARDAGQNGDVRRLETLYYRKWSISATPLAIVALIVALAFRRPWTRAGLTGVAFGLYATQFMVWFDAFPLAEHGAAPPIVLEWAGNALCGAVAAVVITLSRPASRA